MRRQPLKERFDEKFVVHPGSRCWVWTGSRNFQGYGMIRPDHQIRRMIHAHRAAYQIYLGDIPSGLDVCHSCDNPSCVNPEHLWIGTHQENMDDMVRKGRCIRAVGENTGNAKLTEDQVKEILSNIGTTRFAKKFNVSLSTIKRIKNGRTWKHLRKGA